MTTQHTNRSKTMETIRRNSKRIKNLGVNAKSVKVYSLDNGFSGKEMNAGTFELSNYDRENAYFSGNDTMVCVQLHSNLWYNVVDR